MKKTPAILVVILAVAFITAQSFYYRSKPVRFKQVNNYFRAFPPGVSICSGGGYLPADSLIDIPALKGWGNFKWKISAASDSAQFYFDQGISLYYAFHNIESIASFTKATHFAPNCAMAWYGKALSMGPTINYGNGYVPPQGALEAAVKSKQLSENCTPLEKALINAMQQRYSADTTVNVMELRKDYAQAMQQVYQNFSTDANAITLYADSRLLLHPWDLYDHNLKAKPWTPEIRSLLEKAIAIAPKHPGANHYYIHTMEASAHPELALNSAHLLDTLMPSVSHITHMPSHIYIRTGYYERGIKVNNIAVAGYKSYLKRYAPVVNGEGLYQAHNNQLKSICAQMAGNYQISLDAATNTKQNVIDNGYLVLKATDGGDIMQYAYSTPILTDVRFGKWDNILKAPIVDTLAYSSILQHFARGMAYSRKHNITAANLELKTVQNKMLNKVLKNKADNTNAAYDVAKVAELILAGAINEDQKNYTASIALLLQAVYNEDRLIYNEPRDWPLPARQYLGEVLLKTGQNSKAINIFNKDLTINPNNGWSLTGLALAYQATENTAALKKTELVLHKSWKIKDTEISKSVF